MAKDVHTSTEREMEEHCATHIPAKAWCPACVEGQLANPPHNRTVEGDKTVPEVGLDYAFLREANSKESLTILVMKDRETKTIFADAIEMNGARTRWDCSSFRGQLGQARSQESDPTFRSRACDTRPHRWGHRSTGRIGNPAELTSG